MEEILNKKLAKKLMDMKGETRGINFKNDAAYVLKEKGEKGLEMVQKELKRVGCPMEYKEIRGMAFYPAGWRAISLLSIKKAFNWGDEEIKELSRFSVAASLVVRVYMKFFHSIPEMAKKTPKIWREYFTIGNLSVPEYNEEKGYVMLRLEDCDIHPILCTSIEGYLENIIKMMVKAEDTTCKERKCTFKRGKYHEFFVKWTPKKVGKNEV